MKYLVVLLVVFVGVWVWRSNRIATNKDKLNAKTPKKPWWRARTAASICRKLRRWPHQVLICGRNCGFAVPSIGSLALKIAE
jgi:hypothetical protein